MVVMQKYRLMIQRNYAISFSSSGNEDIIAARLMITRELSEMESDNERVVMDYLPMTAYQNTDLGRSVYPNTCTLE